MCVFKKIAHAYIFFLESRSICTMFWLTVKANMCQKNSGLYGGHVSATMVHGALRWSKFLGNSL